MLPTSTPDPRQPILGDVAASARLAEESGQFLPGLVAGRATVLGPGLEVTLAPGSAMPPVLVAGNGKAAVRRALIPGGPLTQRPWPRARHRRSG